MATKKSKSQAQTAPVAEIQERVKALDNCMPYAEKVRLMVLEVLREESAHELASQARFNNQEFNWAAYNERFRTDYAATELKTLLVYAQKLYGLNDLDAVRARRASHKERRAKKMQTSSVNALTPEAIDLEEVEIDFDVI